MKLTSLQEATFILALVTLFELTVATSVVDLSIDFETKSSSPGGQVIDGLAASFPKIRRAVVLEHGKIVADYNRKDVDPYEPFPIWSITKSWTSLIIGMMVDTNLLSLEETLGDVWPTNEESNVWDNVPDASFFQGITIESLLTMTSGLVDPDNYFELNEFDGGNQGGASLEDCFMFPSLDGEPGIHTYLSSYNLLSYFIKERTGMSPREYAAKNIFPLLGMEDSEIEWWKNEDGMEYSFHGMAMNAYQMAKFGQLFLQNGLVAPDVPLIRADWVTQATSPLVDAAMIDPETNFSIFNGYGYLFWVADWEKMGYIGAGQMCKCVFIVVGNILLSHFFLTVLAACQSVLSARVVKRFVSTLLSIEFRSLKEIGRIFPALESLVMLL